jgi:hypothetical protein
MFTVVENFDDGEVSKHIFSARELYVFLSYLKPGKRLREFRDYVTHNFTVIDAVVSVTRFS